MPAKQYLYWAPNTASVAANVWKVPTELEEDWVYTEGQEEMGEGGFIHYQFVLVLKKKTTLKAMQRRYPGVHWEPSRSDAANAYCSKPESRVPGGAQWR